MLKEKIQEMSIKNTSVLSFATFLSPTLYTTQKRIVSYIGNKLSYSTTLSVGTSLHEFEEGKTHLAFLCGLLYVRLASQPSCPVELLAAPVLQGRRYLNKPIYYSDIIVRKESAYTSFNDLSGCVWAYNERVSHSGYNLVCYALAQSGRSGSHFGRSIASGSHIASVHKVLNGSADAAAIDSHMLDVMLRNDKKLASQLRVIAMLGPSTIPPIVVSKGLSKPLKYRIQRTLLQMHADPTMSSTLNEGLIDHFVPIADGHYQDIRDMLTLVQSTGFVL